MGKRLTSEQQQPMRNRKDSERELTDSGVLARQQLSYRFAAHKRCIFPTAQKASETNNSYYKESRGQKTTKKHK